MGHAVRLALMLSLAILASCDDSDDDNTTITNTKTVVSIQFAQVEEGDSGDSTQLSFTLSLNQASTTDVDVTYETTSDGADHDENITYTAVPDTDYTAVANGMVTIPAGEINATIDIDVNGDDQLEDDDTFGLTLLDVSDNAELSIIYYATGTILNDDPVALNDTGITFGGTANANIADCSDASLTEQDCSVGRDNTANDDTDGHAGFSFIKIGSDGTELPAAAVDWSCVQDEVTGLVWEVKTLGGLHDRDSTYTYFDSAFADEDDNSADGGSDRIWAGSAESGIGNCNDADMVCNTESYITDVNEAELCGFSDWRLPTREELRTIVNYNNVGATPAVDANYFPNMLDGGSEWTASPVLSTDADGALVNQRHSLTNNDAAFAPTALNTATGIRLVRFRD